MKHRPWYSLKKSTNAYLHNCYNIFIRAIATAIIIPALIGLSLVLSWVIHQSLGQVGVSTTAQDIVSIFLADNVFAMAVGIALINFIEVWSLVQANFRSAMRDSGKIEMDKLPETSRVGRMTLDALVVSTVWNILLLLMGYPLEDWLGVITVGYVAVWIARGGIGYLLGRIMSDLLRRVKMLAESQGIALPDPLSPVSSMPLRIQLRIIGFGLPVICVYVALSVILTNLIIGYASLAPMAAMAMPTAIIVVVAGTLITAVHIWSLYFALSKRQRHLNPEKIQRRAYVGEVGQRLAFAMSL